MGILFAVCIYSVYICEMGKQTIPPASEQHEIVRVKKLIDLDDWVVEGLQELASKDNRKLKPYMENVLICHLLDDRKRQPIVGAKSQKSK